MQKYCQCGQLLFVKLRTVIFSNSVEIHNVPIYSCSECGSSEVLAAVKPDLTKMIGQLGKYPEKHDIYFNDVNEWARIMLLMSDKQLSEIPTERLIEERINELLDLILLAQSVNDEVWMAEIRTKLQQITECLVTTFDLT